MPYQLYLKKGEEKRIIEGHPWVYANEIQRTEGKDKQGSVAEVFSSDGRYIGKGFINHLSKIIVRLITRDGREIDKNFFKERLSAAYNFRRSLGGFSNCSREVFSESDGMPGLIVDKYADYLVLQVLTLGMDQRKEMLLDILEELYHPIGIYERSDVSVREKEGLQEFKGVLRGSVPDLIEMNENGVKMLIDVVNGQKTGHFLDQKENRAALRDYVKGARVLDCFSHTGGFALHAAMYGAASITACDISETATEAIKRNAELNNFKNVETYTGDVFEYLRQLRHNGEFYDTVILDPPAFTKSSDTVQSAIKGYRDINIQAMKIIKKGGFLVTCSCSHFITRDIFLDMLRSAARSAGAEMKLVEYRFESRDHASVLTSEESAYLKTAILYRM
jgi:23S rRNA (cytosine1962-C5)-methyltransferase